ncbi:MAG: hypothetical protein IT186_03190 [Acidobacteria bacterium]|nr:hypothetical protein [Acidobacteriota bacterium]MCK6681104.1 hypothetical protein [Thermoanaerobaculia bacterium]
MRQETELDAMDDLILGRGVKRGRHILGEDESFLFVERLPLCGFVPRTVSSVEIEAGVRVPAWHVAGRTVDFGMVFWEIFTDRTKRKLFGSEVRNAKGDWDIQVGAASTVRLYVNASLLERYDPSRPVGMY